MSKIQNTTWGYIEWLNINEDRNQNKFMNIGIYVIMPGQHQYSHIHHGEEQLIYVLDGESIQIINGEKYIITKGMHLYIEAETTHEAINISNMPSRHLLVSSPILYTKYISLPAAVPSPCFSSNLYAAVEAIRDELKESIRAPYTIFDNDWKIVQQNDTYSDFCMEKCNPTESSGECKCLTPEIAHTEIRNDYSQFSCPSGMTVFDIPIVFRKEKIGTIRGGHFLLTNEGDGNHEGVYDTPQSTVIIIRRTLQQISKSIEAYCEFDSTKKSLQEKEYAIERARSSKKVLEKSLKSTRDTVTNLRINHHFLFNTLNGMADMALQQKSEALYSAIIDLARMFRYTMATGLSFVKLRDELEYLGNYINLQKLRYGNRLQYIEEIDPDFLDMLYPFNFLQPIVENAFVHGFHCYENTMRIIVEAYRANEKLVISVRNNGVAVDRVTLFRVQKGLKSNSGHGLSLIYAKLASAYGNAFEIAINSDSDGMTQVLISLPDKKNGYYSNK